MNVRIPPRTAILLAILVAATCCWFIFGERSRRPASDLRTQAAAGKEGEGALAQSNGAPGQSTPNTGDPSFLDLYMTKMDFWGRVIDQDGNPVVGAAVKMSPASNPTPFAFNASNKTYNVVTGSNGEFELLGTRGIKMSVWVEKDGYERVTNPDPVSVYHRSSLSTGSFSDVLKNSRSVMPIPTRDSPAIFVLRKKLDADVLNRMDRRRYDLPIDGGPLAIDLSTGEAGGGGGGPVVEIRCWATPDKRYGEGRNAPFDWRCEITAPGGGFVRRNDPNRVVAPDGGYGEIAPIEMPGTLPGSEWQSWGDRVPYWVRLGDGTYARLELNIRVGRKNLIYVDSWHNPTGSRNLEHDPEKDNSL